MKKIMFISGMAILAMSSLAQGTITWNWNYSSDIFSGSGTLTTQNHTSSNTYGIFYSGSGYLITAVTGTFNGSQITGLLGQGSIGNNDDYLLGASQPQLDGWGFSFSTTVTSFNIGYTHSGSYIAENFAVTDNTGQQFLAIQAAPEPSIITLAALGGVGLFLKRFRK
jgi:hypothetical protein